MKLANILITTVFGLVFTTFFVKRERELNSKNSVKSESSKIVATKKDTVTNPAAQIDTLNFRRLVKKLANGDSVYWPAKNIPIPLAGAILPYHRIVAYYGNLYSKNMGILGQLPPKEMLSRLLEETKKWHDADSTFPTKPALHYIAVVAQGAPGADGKYRLRMPEKHIDSVINMAKSIHALVFLDIQIGLSSVQQEVPFFEKYLKHPNVHLGLDPEFAMKNGKRPGTVIGTMDASDINWASNYLKKLVIENRLPPKILILHRFTKNMITNVPKINLSPEVQFVMEMDGWGSPELKKGSYKNYIYAYPKEFTGIKLFYKNDLKNPPHRLLTTKEVLQLKPLPIYIQYQ